jgi:Rrf2 family protein
MKISTKGRYALRVMLDLATNDCGTYIPLKDVSARAGITVKYLEQIVAVLNRAGYVTSSRGLGGGYRLARSTDEYSVGEILRTMEGSLAPVACLAEEKNTCPRQATCPTLQFWTGLGKVIDDYVNGITLSDLLGEPAMAGCAVNYDDFTRMGDFSFEF